MCATPHISCHYFSIFCHWRQLESQEPRIGGQTSCPGWILRTFRLSARFSRDTVPAGHCGWLFLTNEHSMPFCLAENDALAQRWPDTLPYDSPLSLIPSAQPQWQSLYSRHTEEFNILTQWLGLWAWLVRGQIRMLPVCPQAWWQPFKVVPVYNWCNIRQIIVLMGCSSYETWQIKEKLLSKAIWQLYWPVICTCTCVGTSVGTCTL